MNASTAATAIPVEMNTAPQPSDRLGALFDTHESRLYRLARRLASNADDARDLVQETFLRAARSPGTVPTGVRNEEAWLVRVLVNISHDNWRKTAVRRHAGSDRLAPNATDPEPALVARRAIWQALDHLHPRRRAVVIMHELDGMSPLDIASVLGISRVTVRWHLSRARRELATILGPQSGGSR
jgi:RNA polymerase sigma-70 factor, ECF subfamily